MIGRKCKVSAEKIVKYCSPTLAGLKTGSMFNCEFENEQQMIKSIRSWNKILGKKGIRMVFLRYHNNNALIYIYRPNQLFNDIQGDIAAKILIERGYSVSVPQCCLVQLIKRISQSEEFPHEIGLFLGYPPEDVCGFIENKAKCFKCIGTWKVYGDEEKAKNLFEKYRACTDVYCNEIAMGKAIESLIISS